MRWFKNLGLTFKLNLVVILTLGVMLVVLIAVTQTLDDFTLETSQQRVAQEVEVIRRRFAEVEQEMLANTKTLATTPGLDEAVASGDEDAIRTSLLVGASRFNFAEVMDVVDAEGNPLIAEMAENVAENSQLESLRTLALIGSEAVSLIAEEEGTELQLRLVAVTPIRATTSGQIVGGLLTIRDIDDEFMAEVNLGRDDVHIISIADGRILPDTFSAYGSEEHQEINNFAAVLNNQVAIGQAMNGQTVIAEDFIYADGLPHIIAHMPLTVGGDMQSAVGVMAELGTQLAFQRQFINNSTIVYVLLSIAAVIVIGVFSLRSISLPINKLRTAAEKFEQGDFEQRAQVTSGDEIGQLAGSFNNMAGQLQELISSLENRVAQRTQRLEIVAALSEQFSATLNMEDLLVQVVDQVQENFGYYHAHIYLLSAANDQLVLRAGTGSAGARMKADGHYIALSTPSSLVARAARKGEIIRVDNVSESRDWLPNPLLPDTRSEMAVPILDMEGRVIGVLDVQQNEIAGLDEGDAALLRSLANQVAVAIRNARQFAEVETALDEARETQERYVTQSWQISEAISSSGKYHYIRPGMPSLEEEMLTDQTHSKTMRATVTVRDKTIGSLQVYPAGDDQQWTENDRAIVDAVVNQLAQTAESLRLFDETRQQADREQVIREITDKLRTAPNLDVLLETAARELGQRLGARHTILELGINTVANGSEAPESTGVKNNE